MEVNPKPRSENSLLTLAIIAVVAFLFALSFRFAVMPSSAKGTQFPKIEAEGWINGPGPTSEQMEGKILIVDAWAYWCGPCRLAAPALVKLHKKYKDRGVMFIGLTAEPGEPDALQRSMNFVETLNIEWPNGYGARKTLTELSANSIPQLWIVDRDGRVIFHETGYDPSMQSTIDTLLDRELQKMAPASN
jgi:thiol-disulfide isomerase/thioredoxin